MKGVSENIERRDCLTLEQLSRVHRAMRQTEVYPEGHTAGFRSFMNSGQACIVKITHSLSNTDYSRPFGFMAVKSDHTLSRKGMIVINFVQENKSNEYKKNY